MVMENQETVMEKVMDLYSLGTLACYLLPNPRLIELINLSQVNTWVAHGHTTRNLHLFFTL